MGGQNGEVRRPMELHGTGRDHSNRRRRLLLNLLRWDLWGSGNEWFRVLVGTEGTSSTIGPRQTRGVRNDYDHKDQMTYN